MTGNVGAWVYYGMTGNVGVWVYYGMTGNVGVWVYYVMTGNVGVSVYYEMIGKALVWGQVIRAYQMTDRCERPEPTSWDPSHISHMTKTADRVPCGWDPNEEGLASCSH